MASIAPTLSKSRIERWKGNGKHRPSTSPTIPPGVLPSPFHLSHRSTRGLATALLPSPMLPCVHFLANYGQTIRLFLLDAALFNRYAQEYRVESARRNA